MSGAAACRCGETGELTAIDCDDDGIVFFCPDCLEVRAERRAAAAFRALNAVMHAPLHDPTQCGQCLAIGMGFGPSHAGSSLCKSGAPAAGGTSAHCTCDTCF